MRHHQFVDFFHTLVAEIKPANHQQRRDRLRCDKAQDQCCRKQDQKLVLQRAERDLADDRQFACCRKSGDITGCDGRIVNDDASRFRACLGRLAGNIVERRRSHLGQCRDIIKKGDQANTHSSLRWEDKLTQ